MMPVLRNLCFFLFSFFLLSTGHSLAASNNPLEMETEDEQLVRWDLTADNLLTLNDSEILEAKGNVVLKKGNEYLKADFARYYMSTKWVYLKGNVQVFTGKDELKAEEAEFDLRSRVGWLRNGQVFMAGPHVYLAGERIDKHWGDVYTFKKAKVTACDGEVPAWSITANEAVVEIDGYARLTGSAFQVKDTPLAYLPYFVMPTKTSRQTGLLVPQFGRSSSKGVYYNQPLFWAINESSDLTVNEYFMEKRGFMHGLEYRTRPYSDTTAWLRFDWMYDKMRDTSDSSGDYAGDGLVRNNYERFWLRGMLDTRLPDPDWRLKADLDYVADQYYLSEFKGGFSGYSRSRSELFDLFRRDLKERDLDRESGILLTREFERGGIALSSFYTQDPALGNGNRPHADDTTVQRLPQFDAFLHKGRIFPSVPLELEANVQAANMYRRSGTRGGRYEAHPRLSLPLNSRFGSLIFSGGLIQTFYNTENVARTERLENRGPRQTDDTRTLSEFDVEGFTEFARVYTTESKPLDLTEGNVGEARTLGLRHSIQPRLEFRHRPFEDQDRLPRYSSEDRILPRSELVYSLTNVLTAKRESVVMSKNEAGDLEPSLKTSYIDLLRLRLEQAYDYREATRNNEKDIYERRPFGDIFSDLTAYVTDNIYLSTRNNWSPYLNTLTRHQSGVDFRYPEYGSLFVGYDMRKALDEYKRYRDDDIKFLRFDLNTAMYGPLSLSGSFRYDLVNEENHETEISLTYNHQCFKIIGQVSVEPQEENYQLYVVLTGLGD